MNRQKHHAKAEELLEQARTEHDSIRRSLILVEAQVHASLALSAPAGDSPPGPGQPETRRTARGEEVVPSTLEPSGTDEDQAAPWNQPRSTPSGASAEQAQFSFRAPLNPPRGGDAAAPPASHGQTQPLVYPEPVRRRTRRTAEPGDEEPVEEEPDEPGDQGPSRPKTGGFTP